ncbi:MAG: Type I secretion outer membrane protein, TolC family [uncultured bacterium]|nr:MAG: Type I secretion outer membrane protein, TolC family [uncultured bacterium]
MGIHLSKKLALKPFYGLLILSASIGAANAETIKQAIQTTIYSNPEILINAKQRLASDEGIANAWGGFLPKVDLNAGYGRERSKNVNTNFNYASLWRQELGITARQMLFDGFATYNEVKRNMAKSDADAYQVWGTAEDMGLAAAEAYINVLRTQEIVAAAEDNLAAHQRTFGMIEKLGESGLGREADTTQSQGRLDLARANLYAAKSDYRAAVTQYLKIVGHEPSILGNPHESGTVSLPRNMDAAVSQALANHPILKSAENDIKEARAQYNTSLSANYPRLDLVLGSTKNRNLDGSIGADYDTSAMLQLQYNLFRGGSDMAKQRENAYLIQKAVEIRNRTYRQVIEKMRLSWTAYQISQSRMPSLRGHQGSSSQTLGAYRQQFQLGKRTLLDLLDSENEHFSARKDYINGRYDVIDAKYRILNAEGKLLPYFRIPLPPEATPCHQSKLRCV